MTTWCVLATGASMSPALMLHVKHLPCIAVNNAYRDAPWARALVGNDAAWWREYPDALAFAGEKWCGNKYTRGTYWLPPTEWTGTHSNSALCALDLAIRQYCASRVLLLGVDLIGRHYHADHPSPLKNPDAARFTLFRQQFAAYALQLPDDVEVLNCSPISTLECFPKCTLDQALEVATC
jgi:hypothetical protein